MPVICFSPKMNEKIPYQRTNLTLQQRQDVIRRVSQGEQHASVAAAFNIGRSTVTRIVQQKRKLADVIDAGYNEHRKRYFASKSLPLDTLIYTWFLEARCRAIPVFGILLQEIALAFAEKLHISKNEFSASNGWLYKFKKRYDIKLDNTEHAIDAFRIQNWTNKLSDLLTKYDLDDVYNMDETALYFYAFPDKLLVKKGEKVNSWKAVDNRFTIIFCANATGTHKLKPSVLYTAARPRDFQSVNMASLPVAWQKAGKSWNNSFVCEKWLQNLNNQMKRAKRKILLIMDRATCHPDIKLSHVQLLFLPRNAAAKLQPLDAGIIHNFKTHYRRSYFRCVLEVMPQTTNFNDLRQRIPLRAIVDMIGCAWKDVPTTTVKSCFAKCNIGNRVEEEVAPESAEPSLAETVYALDNTVNIADYVEVEGETEITEPVSEADLVNYVFEIVSAGRNKDDDEEVDNVPSLYDEPTTVHDTPTASEALQVCNVLKTVCASDNDISALVERVQKYVESTASKKKRGK